MKHTEAPSSNHNNVASRKKTAVPKAKSSQGPTARGKVSDAGRIQAISTIAFALYEARGREGGHELDDWLRAEAQVDHVLVESDGVAQPG